MGFSYLVIDSGMAKRQTGLLCGTLNKIPAAGQSRSNVNIPEEPRIDSKLSPRFVYVFIRGAADKWNLRFLFNGMWKP